MNTANEIDNVRLVVLDIHHRIANVATELNLAVDQWDSQTIEYRQHLSRSWDMKLSLIDNDIQAVRILLK